MAREVNTALTACARSLLWICVAAICMLTFVWPFAVSPDPAQPAFKIAAIAVLLLFFLSMLVLLAGRLGLLAGRLVSRR